MITRFRTWRCHRGHHTWTRIHPPIWGGGYMQCDHCRQRAVHGVDQYGPAATAWITRAIPPPIDGALFSAADWQAWNQRARKRGRQ